MKPEEEFHYMLGRYWNSSKKCHNYTLNYKSRRFICMLMEIAKKLL